MKIIEPPSDTAQVYSRLVTWLPVIKRLVRSYACSCIFLAAFARSPLVDLLSDLTLDALYELGDT